MYNAREQICALGAHTFMPTHHSQRFPPPTPCYNYLQIRPFGVGALIGGVLKGAAMLKEKTAQLIADAKRAASIFDSVSTADKLIEMVARAVTIRHQEAIRRLNGLVKLA